MKTRMHVSLYATNLDRTIEFYNRFFDTEPAKVRAGYAKYELEPPGLVISFLQQPGKAKPEFGHLGFQVSTQEELNQKLEQAQQRGIVNREEIGTSCCYALQDKFWVQDPDGHQWEVYYFHEDVEVNDPHYNTGLKAACCGPVNNQEERSELANTPANAQKTTETTCC